MDPNQPGSSNPDTRSTTGTTGEKAAAKAQSEIGPTTYGGPKGPVGHGEGDAETKAAYAGGHPSQGIAAQRELQASTAARSAQAAGASGTAATGGTQPAGGTQRVRMVRDEGGHTTGQELELPAEEAQRLIASGAGQAA